MMKSYDDHNLKHTLEHYTIKYRDAQNWLATFRHNVRTNTKLSKTNQEILLNRADKIYSKSEQLESDIYLLNNFFGDLDE